MTVYDRSTRELACGLFDETISESRFVESFLLLQYNYALQKRRVRMAHLIVHPRVHERHPELDEADVETAWNGAVRSAPRISKNPDEYVLLGFDGKGRLVEMVGVRGESGDWLVYHATTPPSDKTYRELGIER